jgi:hypothetical protein
MWPPAFHAKAGRARRPSNQQILALQCGKFQNPKSNKIEEGKLSLSIAKELASQKGQVDAKKSHLRNEGSNWLRDVIGV